MLQLPGGAVPADSLRAVLDSVFAGSAYEWVEPTNPLAFLSRWWTAFLRWLSGMEQHQPLLYWALVWILTAILAAIVVHAVYIMAQTLKAASAPAAASTALATPAIRGAGWYRREAQRLAAQGRFAEAMQADFLGLVLELDQRGTLQFHPSKTPYEYSGEVRAAEAARAAFASLVHSLYGVAFGGEPCGAEDFQRWLEQSRAERYAPSH
ncbi:MAG TPA: DUF4129 domain-containing protein [Gemmatimonadales bacterium]|nr:DUF4129 domain-containing protein [Gemmatimonadales bacterium]